MYLVVMRIMRGEDDKVSGEKSDLSNVVRIQNNIVSFTQLII
jgi:hypothetical protein